MLKYKIRYIYFFVIIILFFTGSCVTYTKTTQSKNFAYLYNPVLTPIHPEISFYFLPKNQMSAYITLNNKELGYVSNTGKLYFNYKVFHSFADPTVTDSGTVIINPQENKEQTFVNIDFNTGGLKNLVVWIHFFDEITKAKYENYFFLDATNINSRYNFLFADANTGQVISRYFAPQNIKIKHNAADSLLVAEYMLKNDFPLLPFSTKHLEIDNIFDKPDTTFYVQNNIDFNFIQKGLYIFSADTFSKTGTLVGYYGKDFPMVKTPTEMLKPLYYLLNSTEYKEYASYKNRKEAIDDFWLKTGKNKFRAKELIKVYYNRVVLANILFTDYKAGWQTDRGMIYIIFGPPKYVYKSPNSEKWVYSKGSDSMNLSFVFEKQKNFYTDNFYILKRKLDYKTIWYQAVQAWRDGYVYSVSN